MHFYLILIVQYVSICSCISFVLDLLCVLTDFYFKKLQASMQVCTKIPGHECHRHRNWDTKFTYWFVQGQVGE